jgi:AcrR family transcriptional regulator
MRRLARDAKLSVSGVYHYVGSKEELLYWIQFNTFDSLLKGLQISLDGVVGPRERLRTAVLNHLRHFGTHMNELKVCAREIDALKGDAYQEVHDRRKAYFDAMHDLVRALPPQPEAPFDSWLATANLFGMLNWFYQWYDPKRSPVSLDDLAEQQTALFLRGYAAPSPTSTPTHDDRSDA